MTSTDTAARRFVPDPGAAWPYLLAAVVAGVVGGLAVSAGLSARDVVLAIAALAVAGAVLWRYQLGAVLIVLTLPLDQYGRVLSHPVSITLFHLALLSTLASWGLAIVRGDAKLRFSAVDWGIGALILAALWSAPFSMARSATLFATVRLVFLWLFTLLYSNVLSTRKVAEQVSWTLLGTGVATSAVALAQTYVPGFTFGSVRLVNTGAGWIKRVGAFFYDPNYLAGFLAVSLLVGLAMLVHSKSLWRAVACLGASAVIGAGVLVTFSRTGLVGVAAGVAIVVLTAPKRRVLPLVMLLLALAIAAFAMSPAAIMDRVTSIGNATGDQSNATRVYMFPSAWEIARDHWVFGTGLSAFRQAYPEYRRLQADSTVLKPHEIPLSLFSETGVAGIIAQLILVWALVKTFWRRRPGGWTAAESFALAGIVSLGVQSLFQYYLYFEYVWLFIAFAVAANRIAQTEEA